jgi:hypothetical protein
MNMEVFHRTLYIYDQHIIFKHRNWLRKYETTIPYTHVSKFFLTEGIFFSEIEIVAPGLKESITLKYVPKRGARISKFIIDEKTKEFDALKLEKDREIAEITKQKDAEIKEINDENEELFETVERTNLELEAEVKRLRDAESKIVELLKGPPPKGPPTKDFPPNIYVLCNNCIIKPGEFHILSGDYTWNTNPSFLEYEKNGSSIKFKFNNRINAYIKIIEEKYHSFFFKK